MRASRTAVWFWCDHGRVLVRDCCCPSCGAPYRGAWSGILSLRCQRCQTEVVALGATATGENAETADEQPWRFAARREESSWTSSTGQLSLIPVPTVVIEFDPNMYVWDEDLHVGAFIAWAPSLPNLAGLGATDEQAISQLAGELRAAACRNTVRANDLCARGQLLVAASRFGADRLVDYLRDLARPAMLSSEYEPVPL